MSAQRFVAQPEICLRAWRKHRVPWRAAIGGLHALGRHNLGNDLVRLLDAGGGEWSGLVGQAESLRTWSLRAVGDGDGDLYGLRVVDDAGPDARRIRHGPAVGTCAAVGIGR